jgi:signal transduction histidine kinase
VATVAALCWAVAAIGSIGRVPRLGVLCSLITLGAGTTIAAMRMGDRHGLGVTGTARDVATIVALFTMAAAIHLVLAMPEGVLAQRARQVAAGTWYAVAAALSVWMVASSRVLAPWPSAVGWSLAVLVSLPALRARYVAAPARGRQRIQALAVGVTLAAMATLVVLTLHALVEWPSDLSVTLLGVTGLVPLGLAAGSTPAASHADRALVHLLTTLGTVAIVSGAYLFAVKGFAKTPATPATRNLLWWAMAAAAAAAVGQLALRGRLTRIATSATYGTREAPDEVVRSFGSRMTRAIPMDELLLQLVESLRKTLNLSAAEIYTGNSEVLELVVSVPDVGPRSLHVTGDERAVIARAGVSGGAWASVWLPSITAQHLGGPLRVAPISYAGELLGVIVVSRPDGAVGFREEDDRVLADLARQVGLALHNSQLDTALQSSLDELRRQADELRASRARVVASGDAERRRVERNLHDGAQQHLVALAVNLRLAKDVVTEDPEAAVQMLDELGLAVQETIRELRELAHGIYPPLLVDSGLGEALRAIANRSPLDVELIADGIGRYGGDIEAAIYFCCLEALQNAAKHASAAHVVVRVWEESGGLIFEVRDDGPGFDVRSAQRGHGYVNMSDRLGAIGGAVRWESEVGQGTTIRGSVPLS